MDIKADALALQQTLQERAQQPRPPAVVDLIIGGRVCGFCTRGVAEFVGNEVHGFHLRDAHLTLDEGDLTGDPIEDRSGRLAIAARALKQAGFVNGWRDELLDVPGTDGTLVARLERAACRTFAISTTAVHLNAWTSDGRLWIAKRSSRKAIDPGLWDTLVGGMLAAGESEYDGLTRESHEEAGLDINSLKPVRGGALRFERAVDEGFQIETIRVYDVVLPDDLAPRNLDGEVEQFAQQSIANVLTMIASGSVTLEASLVTLDGILRR